uniref:UDP-N-acetylglucosamine transferase subunit ALG13 n=1 Tax=Strigamia maritima TaxID=126957 RepID=T1J3R8_STRMM
MSEKTVFVTVGTTSFDNLIKTVTSDSVIKELRSRNYTKILLQIGSGETEPRANSMIAIDYFRYKSSLTDAINRSHLIISHAGAGTILECLEASKPLIVVVNEQLMNNHQTELARQFHVDGYLVYCNPETLASSIRTFDPSERKSYTRGDPAKFINFVNTIMNYEF